MRNLNACQAEVFRRSETRIEKRKQRRKHILIVCIPLALCVSLLSVFVLPDGMTAGSKNSGAGGTVVDGLTGDRYESLSRPIAKITVTGTDFSRIYTNAPEVSRIADQLYAYSTRGQDNHSATGVDKGHNENADEITGGAGAVEEGYTITLVMHNGEENEYLLTDNTLKNLTQNQTYTLSRKQADELRDMLGISHP